LTLLATLAPALTAGPLTPPPGPIASTMRTLLEVEARTPIGPDTTPGDADSLFRITEPGSYYLTGNVTGVAGKSGIEIAASGVTIDLNGFTLQGPATGSGPLLNGITDSFEQFTGVAIINGTINGWSFHGIRMLSSSAVRLADLIVIQNGSGLDVGLQSVVTRCVAENNAGFGISVGGFSIVESCSASSNGANGIEIGGGGIVRACTAGGNGGSGIWTADNAQIVDCISTGNAQHGIKVSTAAMVDRCNASTNTGDGINAGQFCTITHNTCRANGNDGSGAGIRLAATAARTVIRENNCVQNDWGIKIEGAANLVIGNTCTMNASNFEIASGNRVGAIVTLPTSGAISGNSGGSSAPTDPISNFAF
jgi:parallel beta-helix repeat protein